jgi:hypothetical protein
MLINVQLPRRGRPRSGPALSPGTGRIEQGPGGKLYGLSQGHWDGVGEGTPALPNTGRLVVVKGNGTLAPVVDRHGRELVLDRPTTMEFVGHTAYVVSVVGDVYKINNL